MAISKALKDHLLNKHLDVVNLEIGIEELYKFLYLRSKGDGSFISVVPEMDELWHSSILQTREYFSLCETLPSGEYIHHMTILYEDNFKTKLQKRDYYLNCVLEIVSYIEEFGKFTQSSALFWGLPKYLLENEIMSLEEINDFNTWKEYIS